MTDALVEAKVAALMALAEHGPTTDIQEVLVAGDGRGAIAPGAIDKMLAAALQAIEAAGYRVVPVEATEGQWDGLARQIIMWMDMHPKTPRALFAHLKNTGHKVPQWLRDEPEMKHLDHVPSKGTRAVIIYRAMLSAAPRVGDL